MSRARRVENGRPSTITSRLGLVALSGLVLFLAGTLVISLTVGSTHEVRTSPRAQASTAEDLRATRPPQAAPVEPRRRVPEEIAEPDEGPASLGQLPSYLDRLEDRARRNGTVSALEIEDGLAAIGAVASSDEERMQLQIELSQRMRAVQRSLDAE